MKVLVVGTGGSIVSGISTAADQMVRTLQGYGHEVERLNAGEQMRRRSNTLNLENVTAVAGDARAVFRRARGGRADLVWIHTFGVPALAGLRALALVAAARLARRRAVVHFHAFALERFVAEGGPALRLVLRALARLADSLVVLHEPAAEAFTALTGATVDVLPNWVDVGDEVVPLPPQPPLRLVFVGGLVRRKGAPQLVEAMRALDDLPVELRLVGGAGEDGPDALARLRTEAADLVAAGRVSFAGELNPAGVRAELRAAHLFVLPSEAEGTPMGMLEGMAEGRPVLVADAGDMRSIVDDTGCGWVLPDRLPATIAREVRRIAGDPIGLDAAALSARKAAEDSYSAGARREAIAGIHSRARAR
jgi:glycosyltransferase involved in cell wall biosynthesis